MSPISEKTVFNHHLRRRRSNYSRNSNHGIITSAAVFLIAVSSLVQDNNEFSSSNKMVVEAFCSPQPSHGVKSHHHGVGALKLIKEDHNKQPSASPHYHPFQQHQLQITNQHNSNSHSVSSSSFGAITNPLDLHTNTDMGSKKSIFSHDNLVIGSSAATLVLFFYALISVSGPGSWRYFMAGGICAATSHAIPTPIDVVKTRKQVEPDLQGDSFLVATNKIIRKDGVHSLIAGLGPTTIGYLQEGAVKFGVYEALKPIVAAFLTTLAASTTMFGCSASFKYFLKSKFLAFIISGSIAGTAASIILCPMEALRIRLVSDPTFCINKDNINSNGTNQKNKNNNFLKSGLKMYKEEGMNSLFRGLVPMINKQVPYTVTKNVSFDFLTKSAYTFIKTQGVILTRSTMFLVPFTCALIASVLSCISSQPGDMLLSLVNSQQASAGATNSHKTTKDFIREILDSQLGVRGFFVGMQDRMMHTGIIVTLQLLIYDFVKRACGIAATGSM